jgi:hypothetical protein
MFRSGTEQIEQSTNGLNGLPTVWMVYQRSQTVYEWFLTKDRSANGQEWSINYQKQSINGLWMIQNLSSKRSMNGSAHNNEPVFISYRH